MNARLAFRAILLVVFSAALASIARSAQAQSNASLQQRIQKIMARPEFAHSRFGIEFIQADTGDVIYKLNEQELFVPGSTTKLLTEGTALELLGPDYRFHTKIYRTGPIDKHGTLKGDLVLVASGDLDLSNRIQPDDTLAFENEDHSYGGPDSQGLPGDPLLVIHEFARQIAAKGIKRVQGRIVIDDTLFPGGERELGTGVVVSPIVVNITSSMSSSVPEQRKTHRCSGRSPRKPATSPS
jgi:D-alanyl-D-alanine carboxypeptidase/D-alanyl-D-alanine-endopeptidase (penicillin-binding protein 4)